MSPALDYRWELVLKEVVLNAILGENMFLYSLV